MNQAKHKSQDKVTLTPFEQKVHDLYTSYQPYRGAMLDIGVQHFQVTPQKASKRACEWYRKMLAKALAALIQHENTPYIQENEQLRQEVGRAALHGFNGAIGCLQRARDDILKNSTPLPRTQGDKTNGKESDEKNGIGRNGDISCGAGIYAGNPS